MVEDETMVQIFSRIVRVTVFSDVAWATRRAETSLVPGLNRLKISGPWGGMPLDALSVRVERGRLRRLELPVEQKACATELEEERARSLGAIAALKAELALLDGLEPSSSSEGLPSSRAFLEGLELVSKLRAQTLTALREAEQVAKEIELQAKRGLSARHLILSVETEAATKTILEITYPAGRAKWRPAYAMKLSSDGRSLDLERWAELRQDTGEDWDEVELTFSTAAPEQHLEPARTRPWRLEPVQVRDSSAQSLKTQADETRGSHATMKAQLAPTLHGGLEHVPHATASTSLDADPPLSAAPEKLELAAPQPLRCRSGECLERIPLGSTKIPARVTHLCRPEQTESVYAQLTVPNVGPRLLPSGPASIHRGPNYLGEVFLKSTPAGGQLSLELGPEPALLCQRRTSTTKRVEGLVVRGEVHAFEVETEVQSRLPLPAEVVIEERIPVSSDPRVEVRLLGSDPKDATLDAQTGLLTLRAKLSPQGRARVSVAYEIESPQDYRLGIAEGARS